MNNEPDVHQKGMRWLLGAGAVAVAFSIFLAVSDYKLSHSKRDERLGNTLSELRGAQATVAGRASDARQTNY